jgi:hypothetical protein
LAEDVHLSSRQKYHMGEYACADSSRHFFRTQFLAPLGTSTMASLAAIIVVLTMMRNQDGCA